MQILLDTNILFWAIVEPDKVSPNVARELLDGSNQVLASAIGIAELRIKQRIGKLRLPDDFDGLIERSGFDTLDFAASHTPWLTELPLYHRDPFDRMIIAQALSENLTVATANAMFGRYPVKLLKN